MPRGSFMNGKKAPAGVVLCYNHAYDDPLGHAQPWLFYADGSGLHASFSVHHSYAVWWHAGAEIYRLSDQRYHVPVG